VKIFCVLCREEIPPERTARRAVTCSERCAKEYRRQARQDRAGKKCRLCGRRFRKARPVEGTVSASAGFRSLAAENSRYGVVLHEHTRNTASSDQSLEHSSTDERKGSDSRPV
jgi:hypothetical protein